MATDPRSAVRGHPRGGAVRGPRIPGLARSAVKGFQDMRGPRSAVTRGQVGGPRKLDDRALGTPGYTAPTLKRGGRVRGHREGSTLTLISFYGHEGPSADKFLSKLREES